MTLGMDVLRGKTPGAVRKKMWTCLLAYHLIRQAMLPSTRPAGTWPSIAAFVMLLHDETTGRCNYRIP